MSSKNSIYPSVQSIEKNKLFLNEKLLFIFHCLLIFSGISIKKSKSCPLLTVIRYIIVVSMFITMLTGCILIFRFWLFDSKFDIENIQLITAQVMCIVGTLDFAFLIYWQRKDKLDQHNEILLSSVGCKGTIFHKKQLFRFCIFMLSMNIFSFTFSVGSCIFLQESNDVNFAKFALMKILFFDERLNFVSKLIYTYSMFSNSVCFLAFTILCFVDKLELTYLNEQLEKERILNAPVLKKYIKYHSLLVAAVDQADEIFKYYVLKAFSLMVPLVVLLIYEMAVAIVPMEIKVIYGGAVVYYAAYIVAVNTLPAMINSEVSKGHNKTRILQDRRANHNIASNDIISLRFFHIASHHMHYVTDYSTLRYIALHYIMQHCLLLCITLCYIIIITLRYVILI